MAEGDETEAVLTREGTVFGTCAYMSPEQAEGLEVDARSDIFSLGVVLYEMVTGRRAFARDSESATIAAVLRDEPEPDAAPVRVTRGGGYVSRESADGRTLYFARQVGGGHWSVWKMPTGGGEETLLIPRIARSWFFEVTARGIYCLTSDLPGGELRFHRFSDGSDSLLLRLDKRSGFGLAAAPDDSAVIYTVYDVDATELMYVESFR
jgi:serine/threonine protein kinase